MRQFVLRAVGSVALIALALMPSGCGGGTTGSVRGKITVKGKEPNLDGLQISFLGADGRVAMASVNPDGTYQTVGVPVGIVKVGIIAQQSTKRPETPQGAREDVKMLEKHEKEVKEWEAKANQGAVIPGNLRDPLKSDLVVTVEAGKPNTFDYDIK